MSIILGVVKINPLFLHEIEWKNNGFLFTTPNSMEQNYKCAEIVTHYPSEDDYVVMRMFVHVEALVKTDRNQESMDQVDVPFKTFL